MSKNNLGLIEFAKSKIGTNYVYGAKGEILTQDRYNWLKNTYGTGAVWVSDEKKVGTWCVDCSGLISWYTGVLRGSANYYSVNNPQPISTISTAPLGVAVWHSGHIGIYIGNGQCIEAKGSAYGVVISNISNCKFTHWFALSDIAYTTENVDTLLEKDVVINKELTVSIDTEERLNQVVLEVIKGAWGSGNERKLALAEAGYDADVVQNAVNLLLKA